MEHPTLQVLFKGQVLQSVPLDRPMLTVGRLKENDVVIDNLAVSRLHARILLEGDRVFLEDQGSGNGCLLNGRRVDRAPIGPGDEILIGKHQLVLRAPGEAPEPSEDGAPQAAAADGTPWDGAHTYFLAREDDAPEDEVPKNDAPQGHAGLIVQLRGELDRIVSLDRTPFVIGRAPECDLVLAESGVSRQHARILLEGEDYVLEDLGGVNGTFLGGERVERQALEIGDEIRLDVYQMTFVLEDRPIAQEIFIASPASPDDGPAADTAFAETGPPGIISDEGSTSASGVQDLSAVHDVEPSAGLEGAAPPFAEVEVARADEPTWIPETTVDVPPPAEGPLTDGPSSEPLALELEVAPDALPEPLRAALEQACEAGLSLPVTLRLRARR